MKLIEPPDGRPWALLALCGASLLLNVALSVALLASPAAEAPATARAPAAEPATLAAANVAAPAVEPADVEAPPAEEPAAPAPEGVRVVHADVEHSLARTFQNAAPDHADVVAAVYARLFVWDLDLRRDLQKGDAISVAYAWDGELAHIPVASYRSSKLGRTLRAYRFQKEGDAWPSWWTEDGVEVPRRLVDGPMRDYEQVTSLLKDRPKHKGMDFKAPEGTDIVSPRAGSVVRVDWNTAYNGGCVEVKYDDGTLARFLHLSSSTVKPGQRVAAGQVLGLSGNTGRSTAPHLHYELEKAGKVVDPIDYHGVTRRKLGAGELDAFKAVVRDYDRLLAGEA